MGREEFSLFLVKNSLIDKADERFKSLMKWQDVDLFRQPLSFLFPADAHGRLDRLLESENSLLSGVLFPRVPLRLKTGGYINFDMKMEQVGDAEKRLDFYRPGQNELSPDNDVPPTDMYSFFNFVEGLLSTPYDDDLTLRMVSVDALGEESGISEVTKTLARDEIEQGLRKRAVGGAVGVLDDKSYGFLVSGDFDEKAYERELQALSVQLELDELALQPRTSSVGIDDREMPPEQLHQALGHARSIFVGDIKEDSEFSNLSEVLGGVQHNRKLIEGALKSYHYCVRSRSVRDAVKHAEVALLQQGKVNLEGQIRPPDEILVMTDHPDLSLQHDLLQLDDLIRLRMKKANGQPLEPEFYELCRSTLIQEEFFGKLEKLLQLYDEKAGNIGFRIKGLPPVKNGGLHWHALNRLAELGHPVWLDRFGDAVIAPEALGCVKGGFVEIPATLMRKLADHFDGKELMSKLVKTWESINVYVVSIDLPDYAMKSLAQQLGITIIVEDESF